MNYKLRILSGFVAKFGYRRSGNLIFSLREYAAMLNDKRARSIDEDGARHPNCIHAAQNALHHYYNRPFTPHSR